MDVCDFYTRILHMTATFLRCRVKLKELQHLHTVPLINVISKTMKERKDCFQSEDLEGRAHITSFCIQQIKTKQTKKILSAASRIFRFKGVFCVNVP